MSKLFLIEHQSTQMIYLLKKNKLMAQGCPCHMVLPCALGLFSGMGTETMLQPAYCPRNGLSVIGVYWEQGQMEGKGRWG